MANEDIVVRVKFIAEDTDLQNAIKRIHDNANKVAKITGPVGKFRYLRNEMNKLRTAVKRSAKEMAKLGNIKGMKIAEKRMLGLTLAAQSFDKAMRKEVEKTRKHVDMNLLGVGFFFWQIANILENVKRQSLETFTSIADSTIPAMRSLATFSAETQYFNFILGQAVANGVQPFNSALVGMYRAFEDLPSPIQNLIGAIVGIGAPITNTLSWLGFALLGLQNLKNLLPGVIDKLTSVGTALLGFASAHPVLAALIALGLIIGWLYGDKIVKIIKDFLNFLKKVLPKIPDIFKVVFETALNIVSDIISNLPAVVAGTVIDTLVNVLNWIKGVLSWLSMIPGVGGWVRNAIKGVEGFQSTLTRIKKQYKLVSVYEIVGKRMKEMNEKITEIIEGKKKPVVSTGGLAVGPHTYMGMLGELISPVGTVPTVYSTGTTYSPKVLPELQPQQNIQHNEIKIDLNIDSIDNIDVDELVDKITDKVDELKDKLYKKMGSHYGTSR